MNQGKLRKFTVSMKNVFVNMEMPILGNIVSKFSTT
jgi:hypothetical protein